MALFTNLQSLSQTAGANPPDGSADAPSTIPTDLRLLGSFDAIMRDGGHQWASSVGGTNTISITVNGISSLVAGQRFLFAAAAANTGAVTINPNSLGAKSLLKVGNVALTGGELQATCVYEVIYDGVSFQLVGMHGFKNSVGSTSISNGYQYLPSGVLLQWGTGTAGASGGTSANTFPTPFSVACFHVSAMHYGGDATVNVILDGTLGPTTTTFNLRSSYGTGSTVQVAWFAIGK